MVRKPYLGNAAASFIIIISLHAYTNSCKYQVGGWCRWIDVRKCTGHKGALIVSSYRAKSREHPLRRQPNLYVATQGCPLVADTKDQTTYGTNFVWATVLQHK